MIIRTLTVCQTAYLGQRFLQLRGGLAIQFNNQLNDPRPLSPLTISNLLIPLQRPHPRNLMLHNWPRIPIPLRVRPSPTSIRVMNSLVIRDRLQLRHPPSDIRAAGIELFALEQRIEDAEVGLRVDPRAGGEAPAAAVGGEVAVEEVLHEPLLAEAPVEEEVFGEEGGGDHAGAVVHVAGVVGLAHGGVDDRVAGQALGPGVEVGWGVVPSKVGVLWFEGFVHATPPRSMSSI